MRLVCVVVLILLMLVWAVVDVSFVVIVIVGVSLMLLFISSLLLYTCLCGFPSVVCFPVLLAHVLLPVVVITVSSSWVLSLLYGCRLIALPVYHRCCYC